MPTQYLRKELYNAFYDLHVMEKLNEAGIYSKDRFLYNELLSECDRLHQEYLVAQNDCCVSLRTSLVECIKDNEKPKCPHEQKIFNLFHRAHNEIKSKWYGTA